MRKIASYKIERSDEVASTQFAAWHAALKSVAVFVRASPDGSEEYKVPEHGFRFDLRATATRATPDCDLTWGVTEEGRTVLINVAENAGDANVLSAIGEDRERPGTFAVLRQGRLQPNRETTRTIKGGEFRHAFQKLPVSVVGASGPRNREWYIVCDLSESADDIARQTADFVERCALVRARYRGA